MRIPTRKIRAPAQTTATVVASINTSARSTCQTGGLGVSDIRNIIVNGVSVGMNDMTNESVESGARMTTNDPM